MKVKDNPEPQFVLCCARDQVFKREWRLRLEELQIFWGYFESREEEAVMQFLLGNLEGRLADGSWEPQEKAALICDATILSVRGIFKSVQSQSNFQIDHVLPLIDGLFDLVRRESYWDMVDKLRRTDQGLHNHSLNVCLLGLAFVGYLGWQDKDAQVFGVGALLHDLGMVRVPKEILQKEGPLTEDEMEKVRHHPIYGFGLLKNHASFFRNPLLMVLQHHENGDGTGYPQGLNLAGIHPWARILRLVDSYEAMTSNRPWRNMFSPKEALWNIREGLENQQIYDPHYFVAFVKFLAAKKQADAAKRRYAAKNGKLYHSL